MLFCFSPCILQSSRTSRLCVSTEIMTRASDDIPVVLSSINQFDVLQVDMQAKVPESRNCFRIMVMEISREIVLEAITGDHRPFWVSRKHSIAPHNNA